MPGATPIRDVQEAIEAEPGGAHSIPELARRAAMSPRHFTRVFTEEVGEAPGAYVERIRTEAARRQLEETDDTVTVIAARCGFGIRGDVAPQLRSPARHLARPVPQDIRLTPKGDSTCRSPSCCTRDSPRWTSSAPTSACGSLPDTEVRFVWHEPGPIAADSGVLLVGATHSFDETPSPDIILIPGGFSTIEHARDEKVLDWVRTRASDVDVDDVGVLGIGDPGRRGSARGQTRDVALGGGADAADVRRRCRSATSGSCPPTTRSSPCAGVSAGIDLGLWLAGRIGGEAKAKAIQLSMEYDPQPPFDSGHMSKASASTKATATALMGKELAKPAALAATTGLLWDTALQRVRSRRVRRRTPANR